MALRQTSRAFTLSELMVAVVILVVVIVATSKMFGTASKVTGLGQAGAAVLQEAAAVERQLRSDFERLSREGFFVIRCVAVPNDVNLSGGGPLLNASLPADAIIRADQLLFFTHGAQTIQTLGGAAGVFAAGFYAFEYLGVSRSGYAAAILLGAVGLTAMALDAKAPRRARTGCA